MTEGIIIDEPLTENDVSADYVRGYNDAVYNACEWLKNKMHLDQQAFCDDNYIPTENCLEAFRKAMEE